MLARIHWYRLYIWNHFLSTIEDSQMVNATNYWRVRERMSPGSFSYNPKSVSVQEILEMNYIATQSATTLLAYHSPWIESVESVALATEAAVILNDATLSGTILFADFQSVLTIHDTIAELTFVRPLDEMKQIVGLFNYSKQELKLLGKRVWIHQSRISL
jgi:hypothetical protein